MLSLRMIPIRAWFATLALGSLGLVSIGMELQVLLRLNPCPLCIFQRLLYLLIGAIALLGAISPWLRLVWGTLAAALSLGGCAVACYQTWMQAFPHLARECGLSDPNSIELLVDWLGMRAPGWFLATGFCTSRDWVFMGLSMANWSALVFAAIAAFSGWLAFLAKCERPSQVPLNGQERTRPHS